TWAELRVTPKNPSARWTSALARRVAEDLLVRGIKLERVMTDNASEFRAQRFQDTLRQLQVRHTPIHAGRTWRDRKSTRLNSSHVAISYAVFCLKKKKLTRVYMMGLVTSHR